MIHLDSSYLIDLLRETTRGRPGSALDFIERLDDRETIVVSVHAMSELRGGAELSRRPIEEHEDLDRLFSGMVVAYPDARFPVQYGRLAAATRRSSRPVQAMDLLIATAALLDDAALVTRNVKDFSRVPGLRVLSY